MYVFVGQPRGVGRQGRIRVNSMRGKLRDVGQQGASSIPSAVSEAVTSSNANVKDILYSTVKFSETLTVGAARRKKGSFS